MRKWQATAEDGDPVSRLKDLVLRERLRPGDALPSERELAVRTGLSRPDVRAAVTALAAVRVLEVRERDGEERETVVSATSTGVLVGAVTLHGALGRADDARTLREILEIRRALDLALAEAVVAGVTGAPAPELRQLVRVMIGRGADGRSFAEQDRLFHTSLVARAGISVIEPLLGAFWQVQNALVPRLGVVPATGLVEAACTHEDMLVAAEAGDVDAYRDAVERHYAPLLAMPAGGPAAVVAP